MLCLHVSFQHLCFLLHISLLVVNCDVNITAKYEMIEDGRSVVEIEEDEGIPFWGKLLLTFILVIACGFLIFGCWKYYIKGMKKKRKKDSHRKSPSNSQSQSAEANKRFFGDAEMKEVHHGKLVEESEEGSIKVKKPTHNDAKAIISDPAASCGSGTVHFGSEVNLHQISQDDDARTRGQPIPVDDPHSNNKVVQVAPASTQNTGLAPDVVFKDTSLILH